MQIKNSQDHYGSVSKLFHWLTVLILIGMFTIGFFGGSVQDAATRSSLYQGHKATGLLVIMITLLRLGWKLINPRPRLPDNIPAWQRKSANAAHFLLYGFLLAMPFSGWIMATAAGKYPNFYGLFVAPLPGIEQSKALAKTFSQVHGIIAWCFLAVIALHLLAALKHHFINRDTVLRNMLPFTRK